VHIVNIIFLEMCSEINYPLAMKCENVVFLYYVTEKFCHIVFCTGTLRVLIVFCTGTLRVLSCIFYRYTKGVDCVLYRYTKGVDMCFVQVH